jgi:hypothetical protein
MPQCEVKRGPIFQEVYDIYTVWNSETLLKIKNIDVVNNDAFKPANLLFQAMLVKIKGEGKGASVHKPPVEVDDIAIIYKSFNLDVPTDLQHKYL